MAEVKRQTGEEVHFIIATPRMQLYLDKSAEIYGIYLKYFAPSDVFAYSIDEVFIDIEPYLTMYQMTAHELAVTVVQDVLSSVGITATAGIGTNPYLAKVAMDIEAKHMPADKDGVRIAELNVQSYREKLWGHEPLTDFWMIGERTMNRLARWGIHTMGDIARLSLTNEDFFYQEFGVDAELLLDRAWGQEFCTMEHIKNYKSSTQSVSNGQVLKCGYSYEKTKIVVREMAEQVIYRLVDNGLVAEGIVLDIGYDWLRTSDGDYSGPVRINHYGKTAPKAAHGTAKLGGPTAAPSHILTATMDLFERIFDRQLCSKYIHVTAIRISSEHEIPSQLGFFTDVSKEQKEIDLIRTILRLQARFGKNAVFKAYDLMDGATTIERNQMIGGHRM